MPGTGGWGDGADRLADLFGGGPPRVPGRALAPVALVVIAVLLAAMSVYSVQPHEAAVVLRFGAYHGTYGPGLHFRVPLVDRVYKVPVQQQLKQEFGFRTERAGVRTEYSRRDYPEESLMLTGDLNVADVEWIVQYRIQDPRAFLFHVRAPIKTLRDLNEAVMRQIVGDHSVDEVLTVGREAIAAEAKRKLQDLCDRYEIGLHIEQLVLQDVNPPDKVKPSFNEVNQALQEKERLINEAWAEYNRVVPRARGEAAQQIEMAEGYALERVNNAQGDAARFLALYDEYRKAPEVTRRRIYLEAAREVLARIGVKIIADEDLTGMLPLLQLDAGSRGGGK